MGYSEAAWERAMTVHEVILKALSGQIHWFRAAEILGVTARSLRRYRVLLQKHGYDGLFDRRRRTPSPKRAPIEQVEQVLRLYWERYAGWNVRHFHQTVRREDGVRLSYSFVKKALQEAKLVRKGRARGKHRRRREPRARFGELLFLDGSRRQWLSRSPGQRQTLITVLDDATKRLLHAQLWPGESLCALSDVVSGHGVPGADGRQTDAGRPQRPQAPASANL